MNTLTTTATMVCAILWHVLICVVHNKLKVKYNTDVHTIDAFMLLYCLDCDMRK